MDKVNKIYKIVEDNNIGASDVLDLFLNYLGTQIITDEFFEFIGDEGYYIED